MGFEGLTPTRARVGLGVTSGQLFSMLGSFIGFNVFSLMLLPCE